MFDDKKFVFRWSNDSPEDQVFQKGSSDPQYWHMNQGMNDYYRDLLANRDDEVLQASSMNGLWELLLKIYRLAILMAIPSKHLSFMLDLFRTQECS